MKISNSSEFHFLSNDQLKLSQFVDQFTLILVIYPLGKIEKFVHSVFCRKFYSEQLRFFQYIQYFLQCSTIN